MAAKKTTTAKKTKSKPAAKNTTSKPAAKNTTSKPAAKNTTSSAESETQSAESETQSAESETQGNGPNLPRKVFYELLAQSSEKTGRENSEGHKIVIVDTDKLYKASFSKGYQTKRQSIDQRVYKMNKVKDIQIEFRIKSEANDHNVGLDYLYSQLGLFQDGQDTE